MAQRQKPLTDKERVFIERYAATSDHVYAAEKAGYGAPTVRGCENVKNPRIMEQVQARKLAMMAERIMPTAMDSLLELLGPATPPGARVQAVKVAFEEWRQIAGVEERQDLFSLPAGDLAQAAEALAAEIRERQAAAKTIDLEPEEPFFE